jgi:hypothetical protein
VFSRFAVAAVAGLALAACDGELLPPLVEGGAPLPDASVDAPTLEPPDAAVDASVSVDAPRDAGERPDVWLDLAVAPLPSGVPAPRLIVPGPARLIGDAARACTHQVPPSGNGDRWCGFKRAVASGTELWVINASKAGTTAIPCDGTSADCLRLTGNLWIDEPLGGPFQEEANRFEGDTLIFHADATSPPERPFAGPIFAWRPGWPAARRLAAQGYSCYAHEGLPLAFCADGVTYQGSTPVDFDLMVGSVADPAGSLLPRLDHVWLQRADGEVGFGARFSDQGDLFVYSTASSGGALTAGLRAARVTVTGVDPPIQVLLDVMNWEISPDGSKVFYYREWKSGAGRLTMADFPSGANPTLISSRSVHYLVLGHGSADLAVGFFVEPGGRFASEYRVVPDLKKPLDSVVVFRYQPPLEDFQRSGDGRFTGYAKSDDKGLNGYIARTDGSGECQLNLERNRPAFAYAFLDDSSLVFWAERSRVDPQSLDGWLADPADCQGKRPFSARLAYYSPVRSAGVIFADDAEDDTVSLKYAILEEGRWPASGAVRVQAGVDLPVTILRPAMDRIVFQVSSGPPEASGIYVFGPIPFP